MPIAEIDSAEPWRPADATERLREMAQSPALSLAYKIHARQREAERGITNSDVLFVLRTGFVTDDAVPASQSGRFKYEITGRSPNSNGRDIRLIVIPTHETCTIKLVTLMWEDEKQTRAGTLMENGQ